MLTNLEEIARQAATRQEEHEHFKAYLKSMDAGEVDAWVMAHNREAEAAIDCTTCGNCCTKLLVNIDDAAVIRLAEHLQLSETEFRERFVESGSFMQFMNAIPCKFLDGKKCSVYSIRPDECRTFPKLDQPGFTRRMFAIFSHYNMCPIIYNVVEMLKTSSGFRIAAG
jgi:hypothetical protein